MFLSHSWAQGTQAMPKARPSVWRVSIPSPTPCPSLTMSQLTRECVITDKVYILLRFPEFCTVNPLQLTTFNLGTTLLRLLLVVELSQSFLDFHRLFLDASLLNCSWVFYHDLTRWSVLEWAQINQIMFHHMVSWDHATVTHYDQDESQLVLTLVTRLRQVLPRILCSLTLLSILFGRSFQVQ